MATAIHDLDGSERRGAAGEYRPSRRRGFKRNLLTLVSCLSAAAAVISPGSPATAAQPLLPLAPAAVYPQILGGTDVASGAAPYAAFVQADYISGGFAASAVCTGSLVAPTVVLTAGHCVLDGDQVLQPSSFTVTLGLSDISSPPAENLRTVSAVIPYPYFDQTTLRGDAALLILSQPAPAGAIPVPLATTATPSLYALGATATTLGWGRTSNAPGSGSSAVLQAGNVAVQSNATCREADPHDFSPAFDLCAAAPGYSTSVCNGDSGGPLIATTAAGPVQIGIVSYGISAICGSGPDYYTRVSSIQTWVASLIAGVPAPPQFVPAFVAPVPSVTVKADGVVLSFTIPEADPATILVGYTATLLNEAGVAVSSQALAADAVSATFPSLRPGVYAVSLAATYSEGSSIASPSAQVRLQAPANVKKPSLSGKAIVGSKLTCRVGTWTRSGASTFTVTWLRGRIATNGSKAKREVVAADAGKSIACRVKLTASSGFAVTSTSTSVHAAVRLRTTTSPRISGDPVLGATLACRPGVWAHTGTLKLAYRWLRSGKPIVGRASSVPRFKVTAADVGHTITCRVTATAGEQTESKTTAAVRPLR